MEKLKNIMNIFQDKQNRKIIITFIGILIGIIIIIAIIANTMNRKLSYEAIENKLENAAYSYITAHPEEAPNQNNQKVVIETNTLVSNKYMKELSKYTKDSSCSANVIAEYDEGTISYQAYLTCKDFKTNKLIEILKNNNSKLNIFGDGLYDLNGEQVFRGQNPNNYLNLNNVLYRIVKIDKDGKIYLILADYDGSDELLAGYYDDRYNKEEESEKGINNYKVSRVLNDLNDIHRDRLNNLESFITKFDVCVGKRSEEAILNDGSIECSDILTNQYISLLPFYDYANASLDNSCKSPNTRDCQNYNYLSEYDNRFWLATADSIDTYSVYAVNDGGYVEVYDASDSSDYRYVIALNKNILYKNGDGTLDSPYEVR